MTETTVNLSVYESAVQTRQTFRDAYRRERAENRRLRKALRQKNEPTSAEAWAIVRKWLDAYQEEEETFGRYRDDVILDGVMTAGERRALFAALPAFTPPVRGDEK